MGIIDASNQDFSRARSDTWNGSQSHDSRIVLANGFKLLLCNVKLGSQRIELSQFDIELAFPELARTAFDKRLAKRVDAFASGMPSRFAVCDSDAVIDEPSTNDALDLIDAIGKRFFDT